MEFIRYFPKEDIQMTLLHTSGNTQENFTCTVNVSTNFVKKTKTSPDEDVEKGKLLALLETV